MVSKVIVGLLERKHIFSLAQQGRRLDNLGMMEYRPLTLDQGYVKKAEGSMMLTLGKTKLLAGVKAQIGAPFPDTPDEGVLIVNIELSPIASPVFESGPPSKESIEIARVVDRAIRESKVIDVKKLCIVPGEHVWIVFVDIYVLDDHGNIFDAASRAAMSALSDTTFPKTHVTEEGQVELLEETTPLPVNNWTTTMTFAKLGDAIVLDPSHEEERVMSARLTISINSEDKVCALQKGSSGLFTQEEIFQMIDESSKIAQECIEKIRNPNSS